MDPGVVKKSVGRRKRPTKKKLQRINMGETLSSVSPAIERVSVTLPRSSDPC
jgi:hypothetical protein